MRACMYVKSRALEKPKGGSKVKQGLECNACNDVRRVLLSAACAPCRGEGTDGVAIEQARAGGGDRVLDEIMRERDGYVPSRRAG
jgi:hypothetical protein